MERAGLVMVDVEGIEIRLLLEAIHARYGYDLRGYHPESMTRRIQAALARSSLPHLGALQHRILTDPSSFASVFDDLTVRVTDMFRDPTFFVAFRERVVPFLKTYGDVKIWHAGCATGEEVYAVAILLWEHDLYVRSQLYGTDINEPALAHARHGVYAENKVPMYAGNYVRAGGAANLEDYYLRGYGGIAMREWLRRNMAFFHHNLVSDYALGTMQVIFCRNVFIYLGSEARERAMSMFCDSLCRGGFLCLGQNESLPASHERRFQGIVPEERIYQYKG
jgi:chemotaxis protein methyltransferase CheR